METNIRVKKIYTKQGVGKFNKPYLLTKLQSESGDYFCTFKPDLVKEIKEGMNIVVVAEKTDRTRYYNITEIKGFSDSPAKSEETFNKLEKELTKEINPEEIKAENLAYIESNLNDSCQMIRDAFKLKPEDSLVEYADLIAELCHEMYSLYITKEIQLAKLKNMGMIK